MCPLKGYDYQRQGHCATIQFVPIAHMRGPKLLLRKSMPSNMGWMWFAAVNMAKDGMINCITGWISVPLRVQLQIITSLVLMHCRYLIGPRDRA